MARQDIDIQVIESHLRPLISYPCWREEIQAAAQCYSGMTDGD